MTDLKVRDTWEIPRSLVRIEWGDVFGTICGSGTKQTWSGSPASASSPSEPSAITSGAGAAPTTPAIRSRPARSVGTSSGNKHAYDERLRRIIDRAVSEQVQLAQGRRSRDRPLPRWHARRTPAGSPSVGARSMPSAIGGELISRMDQIPQRAGRCPFLSGTLNKSTTCVTAENSRGVCTISATSNGHRQDWHRLVKTCYGKSAPGWPRDLPAAQVPRVVLVQNYARIITGGLEVVRRRRAGSTNPAAQLQPKTTMMCTAVGKTAGQGLQTSAPPGT